MQEARLRFSAHHERSYVKNQGATVEEKLGMVAAACALLGLIAGAGQLGLTTKMNNAARMREAKARADGQAGRARDLESERHMGKWINRFLLVQMMMGVFAVGLGCLANARGKGSGSTMRLGDVGWVLGLMDLLGLFVFV
jgi:hypothetical protein